MRIGSLCSGYGGLDLAVENHFGARTAWVADIDKDSAAVLAERFPLVPNLGDIKQIDWAEVPAVDIVTAGYPCQPFSQAGLQKGEDDPRHLWPEILRAIRALRPRHVVLENVQRHLRIGFPRVLADLAEAGFDAEWCLLRASEVGAPHRRARLFALATNTHRQPAGRHCRADAGAEGEDEGRAAVDRDRPADGGGDTATDPDGGRREIVGRGGLQHGVGPTQRDDVGRRGAAAIDPDGDAWGTYAPAVDRWERIIGRPAPQPLNPDNPKQLNALFVEWMMGLPEGWVTDLIPNRRALHTLGNGVVPQQAAAALRYLDGA